MTVKGGSNMNMAWVKRRFLAFPSVSARVFTLVVMQARLPLKFNTTRAVHEQEGSWQLFCFMSYNPH